MVIAAIAGMGGLGKTELALQYANAHREIYKGGICWLLAKAGDVGIQIVQSARTQLDLNPPEDLDLPAQVQYCFRLWCEGNVLLVLDDVGEYQQIKPYLSLPSSRFKVLITTRQHLGASIKELSFEQITAVSPAIPHIAEVANHLIQYLSDDDLPWPFDGNATFYNAQGLYKQAIPWYEQCLEVTKYC